MADEQQQEQQAKPRDAGTINTEDQVPGLSIRDMVRQASLQLRGVSKKINNGYLIEMRNYSENLLTRVHLTRSKMIPGATDLKVETGKLKDNTITSGITLSNILHLYVTWESQGMVSFCFANDGRFTLVNVSYHTGSFILNSVDRRANEDPGQVSAEAQSQRRTFYHIGTLFDHSKQVVGEGDIIDEAEERQQKGG